MIYLKTRMRTMPKGCAECGYYDSGVVRMVYDPYCGAVGTQTMSATPLPDNEDLEVFKPKWCPLVDGIKENK